MSLKTYFCYLKLQQVSNQARQNREHISTQGTLAREHLSTQGTLAREHVCTQGTLAREHVRHAIQQTQFTITKFTLYFSYSFHAPFIIPSKLHFNTTLSMFAFLFNQSQSIAGVVNQMIDLCFPKRFTIDQLNVQPATAEKEK